MAPQLEWLANWTKKQLDFPFFFPMLLKGALMLKGRSFLVKMVKDDSAGHQEEVDVADELKSHLEKYKVAYISGGVCFAVGLGIGLSVRRGTPVQNITITVPGGEVL
jgi:hypothetical protein